MHIKLPVTALALLVFSPQSSFPQGIDAETAAQILEIADGICGEYFLNGNRSEQSFSGAASGHVKGLAKWLADVGAEGEFNLDEADYFNVLHGELGTSLKDLRTCKLQVWNDLKETLVTE